LIDGTLFHHHAFYALNAIDITIIPFPLIDPLNDTFAPSATDSMYFSTPAPPAGLLTPPSFSQLSPYTPPTYN
jgi:hypothetical protein